MPAISTLMAFLRKRGLVSASVDVRTLKAHLNSKENKNRENFKNVVSPPSHVHKKVFLTSPVLEKSNLVRRSIYVKIKMLILLKVKRYSRSISFKGTLNIHIIKCDM